MPLSQFYHLLKRIMVRLARFELTHHTALDPKSSVSANSTTGASMLVTHPPSRISPPPLFKVARLIRVSVRYLWPRRHQSTPVIRFTIGIVRPLYIVLRHYFIGGSPWN